MAQVKLTRIPGHAGQETYRAEFDPLGRELPRKPQMSAREMLSIHTGLDPLFEPRGTEEVRQGFQRPRKEGE